MAQLIKQTMQTMPPEVRSAITTYAFPSSCRLRLTTKAVDPHNPDSVRTRWSATTSSRGTDAVHAVMLHDEDLQCEFDARCAGSRILSAEIAALFNAYRLYKDRNANKVTLRLETQPFTWIEYMPNDNGYETVVFMLHDGTLWYDEYRRLARSTDKFEQPTKTFPRDFTTEQFAKILTASKKVNGKITVGDGFLGGDEAKLCLKGPPVDSPRLTELASSSTFPRKSMRRRT